MWGFGFQYSFVVFGTSLGIYFLRSGFGYILGISILWFKILSSKLSQSPKIYKMTKITLTKHGVIRKISKLIKIRDQGMEIDIFVLYF